MMLARIARCESCEQWTYRRNWRWPRCQCSEPGALVPPLELSGDLMRADLPGCPMALWDDLIPVDVAALDAEQAVRDEAALQWWAENPMLARLDDQEAVEAIAEYVEKGWLTVEYTEQVLLAAKGIEAHAIITP